MKIKTKNNLKTPKKTPKNQKNKKFSFKKKFFLITSIILGIFLLGGGFFVYKTGYILNKISESENSNIGSVFGILPVIGRYQAIQQDGKGRTNVLLMGMRGENMSGGGLLADTIILASLKLDQTEGGGDDKIGLASIPRDLYVKLPNADNQHAKINSVYYHGEERLNTTGLSDMKEIVSEVTGLKVHYSVVLNFNGFEQLIDAVGGVEVDLAEPFIEPVQFHEMKVCDGDSGGVFTVETGEFEEKIDHRGKVVAKYPLCYNPNEECGGVFSLPAGKQVLDGETALCYVRSRATSSDFDRAKRQQLILKKLKDKLVSLNTFSNFSRVNDILDVVGNNVKTDMSSQEMKKFFEKYNSFQDATIYQRVLENSEEGMLKAPQNYPEEVGYVLIPHIGQDNYSEIHNVLDNLFNIPIQSDIKPINQQ